jgi:hypothetical protein
MGAKLWKVIYRPKGKRRERCDETSSSFASATGRAIELTWGDATVVRILPPEGTPMLEADYASIVWKTASGTKEAAAHNQDCYIAKARRAKGNGAPLKAGARHP